MHFHCTSQSLGLVESLKKCWKHLFVFLKLMGGILETVCAFSLDFSKFKTSRLSYKILKTCICISEIRGGGVFWRQLVHFLCTSQSLRFVAFLAKYFKHVFAFLKWGGVYWKQFVHFHWNSQSSRPLDLLTKVSKQGYIGNS